MYIGVTASARLPQFGPGLNAVDSDHLRLLSRAIVLPAQVAPVAGGTMTIGGRSLGSYDYVLKRGNIVVDDFDPADWFTNTADARSAIVMVDGDLTINSGEIFTPPVRKLYTVLFVRGTLTVNGAISMTARGANHSAETGSNIPAADILIAQGLFSGVTNPRVPAGGGAGGWIESVTRPVGGAAFAGLPGEAGTNGGSGGGGMGAMGWGGGGSNRTHIPPHTAPGTSFSGGSGSGAFATNTSASNGTFTGTLHAGLNGGVGGAAQRFGTVMTVERFSLNGGAGNPGGIGSVGEPLSVPGEDGTGGTLIVIANSLAGDGQITAHGAAGGVTPDGDRQYGGGGSGGGSITVLAGQNSSSITPAANGGVGGWGWQVGTFGGNGGAGTARILTGVVLP